MKLTVRAPAHYAARKRLQSIRIARRAHPILRRLQCGSSDRPQLCSHSRDRTYLIASRKSRRRVSTYLRSVGARGSRVTSAREIQRKSTCSRHEGSPLISTGTKVITYGEFGSRRANSSIPTETTSTPSSSASSRRAASASDSPGSHFPPGNSQSPPWRFSGARWQTSTSSPRDITAAITRITGALPSSRMMRLPGVRGTKFSRLVLSRRERLRPAW
jgi:hypothetical protein